MKPTLNQADIELLKTIFVTKEEELNNFARRNAFLQWRKDKLNRMALTSESKKQ